MKNVFVIILNWNGKEDTLVCLASLKKITHKNVSITPVVVDNHSSDDSIVQIKKQYPQVHVIENKKNLGFAAGNNVGIRYALKHSAYYVLLVNNDTIADKNLVQALYTTAETYNKIGIVVPKIYFAKGYEFHKARYKPTEQGKVIWYAGGEMDWENVLGHHRGVDDVDKGQYDKQEETALATGCCMLVRRSVFEEVGVFNERYFLYYEDSDFCERVKQAGYTIQYEPSAVLWHKNAGSSSSGSNLQDYYISRNRLLFGTRFAPIRAKFALLKESIRLLFTGRPWQRRGIIDFYLGNLGKGSYPV